VRCLKILIADDNTDLNNAIYNILTNHNYEVKSAYDGKTALRKAMTEKYDVILLDIMMPQMNGYEVLKKLRESGRDIPIILITAKDDITDMIEGLDLGADDYLQKPFNMNELLARIRAVSRRNNANKDEMYLGDITLNLITRKLIGNHMQIELTENEYNTLRFLFNSSEIIVPLDKLIEVSGIQNERLVTDILQRLESILKIISKSVRLLHIKAIGYKICC